MSVDYEERERVFDANIEGMFKEIASNLAVQTERVRELSVMAYRADLQLFDARVRILDDIVAIAKSGDSPPEEKYRKIDQLLKAKGELPN